MAFSLPGFGAGLSSTLNEILTTRNTRIAAREDEEASLATRQRLKKQASRDSKNEISKKLAEKLSAMYTPEVAERFMAQGIGYAEHYLDIGSQASADNVDPMSYINADALAVPMLLPDGSNRVAVEKAALRFGSAAEGGYPSLINREAMYTGKAEDLKIYTSFEQQHAAYSAQYTDLMNPLSPRHNPKKAQPLIALRDAARDAIKDAAEKDPNKADNIFSDTSRTTILKDFRRDQLQKQQFSMGVEDQIEDRIYGDKSRQHVAEIIAMDTVDVFNKMDDGSIGDVNLSNVAAFNRANAEKELRKIASLTYSAAKAGTDSAAGEEQALGLQNNFKAAKGNDGLFVALNEEQLQSKVASGSLSVGDVVIFFNPINNTNQLIIYTGAGQDGFIGAASLTDAQMRYN
tara:strand:- start:104 stop:1312 length:1209 start_codon:yes stop_codon:yes gene_type:complete